MLCNVLALVVQSTEAIKRYPSGLSVKARMTSSPTEAKHDAHADMQVPSQTDASGVSAHSMTSQQPAGNQQQPEGNQQQSLQNQQRPETDTRQQGSWQTGTQAPASSCDAALASDTQHGMHHQSAPSSAGQHTECLTDAQQSAAVLAKWGMAIPPQLQQQLQEEQLQQQQQQEQMLQQLEHVQPKQQLQQQQLHHKEEQVQLRQLQQLAEPAGFDSESSNVGAGHTGGVGPTHKAAEEVGRGDVELTLEQPDGESRPPVVAPEVVRGRVVRATELWHKQLSQQEAQQQVTVDCKLPGFAFIGLHSTQGSIQVFLSSGT